MWDTLYHYMVYGQPLRRASNSWFRYLIQIFPIFTNPTSCWELALKNLVFLSRLFTNKNISSSLFQYSENTIASTETNDTWKERCFKKGATLWAKIAQNVKKPPLAVNVIDFAFFGFNVSMWVPLVPKGEKQGAFCSISKISLKSLYSVWPSSEWTTKIVQCTWCFHELHELIQHVFLNLNFQWRRYCKWYTDTWYLHELIQHVFLKVSVKAFLQMVHWYLIPSSTDSTCLLKLEFSVKALLQMLHWYLILMPTWTDSTCLSNALGAW